MVAVPELEGVKVLVQVAVPAVVPAAKVHVVKVPVTPATVKVTETVGVLTGVGETSGTVAVHVEAWLTTPGLVQVTAVVVARLLTVSRAGGGALSLVLSVR